MFNVTVLRMKDIKKYLIGMIITILVIILASKYIQQEKAQKKVIPQILAEKSMVECLDQTISTMDTVEENHEIKTGNVLQGILKTQIASIDGLEVTEETTKEEQNEEEKPEEQTENEELAEVGLQTQVITNNPLKESYNTQYGKVKIKNETEYQLTDDILKPDITIENKNIILFHTHSCESYTSSDAYPYTPTGTYRTTDLNFTVTRVGTELENQLKQYNYNVVHDTSYHDYPAYNGSYTRSLATVENILKQTPADIIIDVHRDAIGSRSDYAPIVKIGENDVAAQIMFVIRN